MRYFPDSQTGLSAQQIHIRHQENLLNHDSTVHTKSIRAIVISNLCTLFNLINAILAAAVFSVGSYKNMLFLGVVISNLAIGIIQEIRAKRTIDKLSLLHATKAAVIRNGQTQHIPIEQIVLDDVLFFHNGNQVMVDCILLEGQCQVNESFITGESDPIYKEAGDTLLAGSFITSGQCYARADRISEDTYISSISKEAKYYKRVKSDIMQTINRIIATISALIVPVGLILFYNQWNIPGQTYQEAVVQTVAALVGMIPEGLVLLTSTVLAVGVVRLSKHQVMVQELYCIEALARVDTLCLDKTGTITEGSLFVTDLIPLEGANEGIIVQALNGLTSTLNDHNATFLALQEAYHAHSSWLAVECHPFSSQTKRSAVTFEQHGTYLLGAAEFILPQLSSTIRQQIKKYSQNHRVLLLAHSPSPLQNNCVPAETKPVALILLKDKIRATAPKTLAYFAAQGVDIKVISGDSIHTVAGVAKDAGVHNWDKAIDMTNVLTEEALKSAAAEYTIFGRVSPTQKKQLVLALKEQGRTVAMTGDGVNDVLALKESDCSIAMASGSDAARNVAQLVLLDSNFDALPKIVAEGRRSINNLQRSSSLFLVKTIYATLLSILFLFIKLPYPFIPIQLTLISCVTIGIPSFILALEPNENRIEGRFLLNILSKALPGGLTIVCNLILILLFAQHFGFQEDEISTLSLLLSGFVGFLVLYRIGSPLTLARRLLFMVLIAMFALSLLFFPALFAIVPLSLPATIFFAVFLPIDYCLFQIIFQFVNQSLAKKNQ